MTIPGRTCQIVDGGKHNGKPGLFMEDLGELKLVCLFDPEDAPDAPIVNGLPQVYATKVDDIDLDLWKKRHKAMALKLNQAEDALRVWVETVPIGQKVWDHTGLWTVISCIDLGEKALWTGTPMYNVVLKRDDTGTIRTIYGKDDMAPFINWAEVGCKVRA